MRNLKLYDSASLLVLLCTAICPAASKTVFVEAEGFDDPGGWMLDQQFIDIPEMGSTILLAHGMGIPVKDATTEVEIPAEGTYRVWVRTRDWVAPWKAPGAPGSFKLLVNDKELETTFGVKGDPWHWQGGGEVKLPAGKVKLTLHDLKGFDARCDAIILSADKAFVPPNTPKELSAFRKKMLGIPDKPVDAGEFDVVVVGGGLAGACAAVSSARLGLKTALIHNRPVLGGNNSSEVRVHLGGKTHLPPYPKLGGLTMEFDSRHHGNARPPEYYDDPRKMKVASAEPNLELFMSTHGFDVEMKDKKIVAVMGRNIKTNEVKRFPGRFFVDCTGDGTIGFLAGADYRYGRESQSETKEKLAPAKGDRQVMGTSIMWYAVKTTEPSPFPDCPWAAQFTDQSCQQVTQGNWNWENGFYRDQVLEAEYIRDYGLRVVFGNWAFQKNQAKNKSKYANMKLGWVAYVGGKRESRRLLGDVILTQQDVQQAKQYPDASYVTTWSIDLHYPVPTKGYQGEPFRSVAKHLRNKPYACPYRTLYSRNIENLFMAGRNISVTHVALGTIRVMRTTGMMGEVVGMAAAVCVRKNTTPRGVYEEHLDDLKELMTKGVGKDPAPGGNSGHKKPKPAANVKKPDWLKDMGPNLAKDAKVTVSGNYGKQYPPKHVNDGKVSYTDNALRWVSDKRMPGTVDLTWSEKKKITAVRIVSGQSGPKTPIADFVVQYKTGDGYKDIPGTETKDNNKADWGKKFDPIETDGVRLKVTKSDGDLIRIWEFEVY